MKQPLAAALLIALSALSASPSAAKQWKNSVEFSYMTANGNTKLQSLSGRDAFTYDFSEKTKAELEAGGNGARTDRQVQAEQYYAVEKISRKLTDRDYVFERYRWDRNFFAGIKHRHDFAVGLGRELWKTDRNLLIGEASPGYVNEERIGANHVSYASARLYSKYSRKLNETASFTQDAEYIQSLADNRDRRVNAETTLTAALTSVLSVKNSFQVKHNSRPPAGRRKDDTILMIALLASF